MISLLVLSHSPRIAEGVGEMAQEMSREASIYTVGGQSDGTLGADYARTQQALGQALADGEVVVLFDLGSTGMTLQMVLEELTDAQRARVLVSDAALVEGAIVAAVGIGAGFPLAQIREQLAEISLHKEL